MIEELITSRARRKILALFLLNPNEKYYLREISRLLNEETNVVSNELRKLENMGLIQLEIIGRARYYQANPECAIYQELRSIFLKITNKDEIQGIELESQ